METYKTDAIVGEDGTVTVTNLPFHKGERVEVILLQRTRGSGRTGSYPLRGESLTYADPFGSVAEEDWTSLS
jgi:hypothetical protein